MLLVLLQEKYRDMKSGISLLTIVATLLFFNSNAQHWGIAGFGLGNTTHNISNTARYTESGQDSIYTNSSDTRYSNIYWSMQGDIFKEKFYFSYDFGFSLKRSPLEFDGHGYSSFSNVYRRFLKLDMGWGKWNGEGIGWWLGIKYETESMSQNINGGMYFDVDNHYPINNQDVRLITQIYHGWRGLGLFAKGMTSLMNNHLMIHGSMSVFPINSIGSSKRGYGAFAKMAISPEISANYLLGEKRNWGLGLSIYSHVRKMDEDLPEEQDEDQIYSLPEQKWSSFNVELKLFLGLTNAKRFDVN